MKNTLIFGRSLVLLWTIILAVRHNQLPSSLIVKHSNQKLNCAYVHNVNVRLMGRKCESSKSSVVKFGIKKSCICC